MKVSLLSATCILGALHAATSALALDPIEIKGSKFFNSKTGEQFFFKGIAYQPRTGLKSPNPDPLADVDGCKRDIPIFKELGINSIRVYDVDYNNDHDKCMNMLEDAGIYLLLDIPSPDYSINRAQPYWDHDLMKQWVAKVDTFSKYSNLLAWIAGNEVANDVDSTPSAAFVKAAIRDMKAYMKNKGLKTPIGYVDNDDMNIRMNLINYFNCGDEDTRADFYGINTYRWCGSATFESSGYSDITKNMTGYSIPSLLTEFGCNLVRPRTFTDLKSLYGSDMAGTFSGGILYEYSEEDNGYGIVKVSYGDSKVEKNEDFDNFKKALANVKPTGVKISDYKPNAKNSECPSAGSSWKVKGDALPPTPSAARCQCMLDSLACTFKNTNLTASEGKAVGEAIGHICGQTSCDEISYNTEKGEYGNYVACDSNQRAAWVVNKNAANQKYAKCEIDGAATTAVSSPKVKDTKTCLTKEDDIGNIGSPSSNVGSGSDKENDQNSTKHTGSESDGEDSSKGSETKSSDSSAFAQPLSAFAKLSVAVAAGLYIL
ncbi:1 3-beta-glucanosyltransferase gel4 [Coemansia spiralis]|uniref:1,3-beta-glucanosyltransferase n=2 Tax=Coemansia TaxID=4863 RepID=A0A9W8KYQ8_9FUNG|nr:Glucanosyltransferase-domain-containing protein [Coemansia spiralis]KAJ1993524.1 1 3-beta-glucanosyltransferase gel4 [Coemansia umbellata]KAJ2625233.1 1 3-beta-glucanosyltransferase gel4 [Coemansia sp. RSA 1358]KAJ2677939.1 1 3-beta-glucanosyltransferase gel4 [Coemansia spiralis]